MTDFQEVLSLIEHLNDQSKFQFDKLVSLFIFFCTINLTGLVSGYLTIINTKEENSNNNEILKKRLINHGSIGFLIASVIGSIGTIVICVYFYSQKIKVNTLFKKISESKSFKDIPSIDNQYIAYIIISILFIFAMLIFSFLWNRIRIENSKKELVNTTSVTDDSSNKNETPI